MSHPTADGSPVTYDFDRFLRYDEMVAWLHTLAAAHPDLVELSVYGRSNEGRELWLVSVTDSVTGTAASKPAHWVDANIHSVEVTGGVAALHLLHHLTARRDDPAVAEMLRTRTMYVAPRVNPDGVEAALADRPRQHRSRTRPWPRATATAGRGCTRPTSTATDASGPCASPTNTARGSNTPTTRG